MLRMQTIGTWVAVLAVLAAPAAAQFVSGSDGSDGALAPGAEMVIDLSLAGGGPGTGTYDADDWVVIFDYTTIDIPVGTTVTFLNHPSGAPVVWLASGNVNIDGAVKINGSGGTAVSGFAEPGPGGFAGGRRRIDVAVSPASAGFGPGGAPHLVQYGGGGGYGTVGGDGSAGALGGGAYGNEAVLPLLGGSGGGGGNLAASYCAGGGAGAGAILIAASGTITLSTNGLIEANGGNAGYYGGAGSGGGIRLLANTISGDGRLRALGGNGGSGGGDGGLGRIRVEAFTIDLVDTGNPTWNYSIDPGPVFPAPDAPRLSATVIDGEGVPVDPEAGITTTDVVIADTLGVVIEIEAHYVPLGSTVQVRCVPNGGADFTVTSGPLTGTLSTSTAQAVATFPARRRVELFLRSDFGKAAATNRTGGTRVR